MFSGKPATKLPSALPPHWPNSSGEEIEAFGQRHIAIGEAQSYSFVDNFVKTSKYEVHNFLPKFLFEEFHPSTKTANCYFLLISALQCVPPISNTKGMPTTLIPLLVVILVDAIFQIMEDISRHSADILANSSLARKYDPTSRLFVDTKWSKLNVGDIICIKTRESIPADCIILSVSEKTKVCRGNCYIDTKSLDGETNLKMRMALSKTSSLIRSASDIQQLVGCIEMEHPNKLINAFSGIMDIGTLGKFPILPNNILLRGCTLRNTEWVIALVVNTGHDTKIMMSSLKSKTKQSGLEIEATKQIQRIIIFLALVCFGAATGQAILDSTQNISHLWYLKWNPNPTEFWFVKFFYSVLLHATFIPVSLYVSMSLVRFYQSKFMNDDLDMYHADTDTPCLVRTMTLNEELGQISHIFSDKTGTLTRNVMDFRKASINGVPYGQGITEIGRSAWKLQGREIPEDVLFGEAKAQANSVPHVSFYCPRMEMDMQAQGQQAKKISYFFRVLSICHDIIPETHDGVTTLSANSPDDEALVYAAKYFEWSFLDRVESGVVICNDSVGLVENVTVLETIEFSSKRKRMSVFIRDIDDKIKLLCKGADSVIFPRLQPDQDQELLTLTNQHLIQYAEEGLRCLLITHAELSQAEFEHWHTRYKAAKSDMLQIERKRKGESNTIEELEDDIEMKLELLGVTAIEDRLQDGVPECIEDLVDAGLNIWILTGDKEETAINIAVACNLVLPQNYMVHIVVNSTTAKNAHAMSKLFEKELKNYEIDRADVSIPCKPRALIIDGSSLLVVMADSATGGLRDRMLMVCQFCKSVVCCRVSPDQKREIVSLIRTNVDDVRTLAIGDGANDVAMIQAAHVGVGISGVEGMQAVNSADFAIAQFRFLSQLVLKHGRYNYVRMGHVICYTFYKNVLMSLAQFWFNFNCLFSGQKYYTEYGIQLYNLLFSSIPILLLGIYDMDIPSMYILSYPKVYLACINHEFFTSTIFWTWIAQAVLESVVLSVVPLYLLKNSGEFGETNAFLEAGATTFTTIIIVINVKILFIQCRWYSFTLVAVLCSILAWWLIAYVINTYIVMDFDWFQLFNHLLNNLSFWLTVTIMVTVVFAKDAYIIGLDRNFNFRAHHILQEAEIYTPSSSMLIAPSPGDEGVNLHAASSTRRNVELSASGTHTKLNIDEEEPLYNVIPINE